MIALTFRLKEVPDIQRFIWTNPEALEAGISWDKKEYPLDMKVDFKGQDATGIVVLAEAKNKAKQDHVYQAIAQKYRYWYAHIGDDFRMILVCYATSPEVKSFAEGFDIEVIELGEPMVVDVVADYDQYQWMLPRRQFEAFGYLYIERLSSSETAQKMGISIARVSTLKKEIKQRIRDGTDELVGFVQLMKQAPEVFKETLEEILEV